MIRDTWVELDLNALEFNISQIKKQTNNSDIIAVVKTNAYGHGVLEIIPVLIKNNITKLAVATIDEAITIREKFNNVLILIFNYTSLEISHMLYEYDFQQSVFSYEYATDLSNIAIKNNKIINIHIKLDTGMSRLGFYTDDKSIEQIKEIYNMKGLNVIGIFSHFASSDAYDKTYSYKQFDKYLYVIKKLEEFGINVGIKHIANSGAILDIKETHMGCVRPGKILYGFLPSDEVHNHLLLKPILSLKSKIISIKYLDENTFVGYNNSFKTNRKTIIAILSIGYGDGYSRRLSHKIKVLINNKLAPVIATICMNLCMIDVTDVENVKIGDIVTLYGEIENFKEISIYNISKLLGTNNYEVLCNISDKLPRICL